MSISGQDEPASFHGPSTGYRELPRAFHEPFDWVLSDYDYLTACLTLVVNAVYWLLRNRSLASHVVVRALHAVLSMSCTELNRFGMKSNGTSELRKGLMHELSCTSLYVLPRAFYEFP